MRRLTHALSVDQAEAERVLLRAALADPSVQRMVLLSESCIPLYGPTVIYHTVSCFTASAPPWNSTDQWFDSRPLPSCSYWRTTGHESMHA